MRKPRTRMIFKSIEQRDKQLAMFAKGSYEIDRKNPLVIYLNF